MQEFLETSAVPFIAGLLPRKGFHSLLLGVQNYGGIPQSKGQSLLLWLLYIFLNEFLCRYFLCVNTLDGRTGYILRGVFLIFFFF